MGQKSRNIVALVQARMSSRRLPGKVLLPLAGTSVLEHVCRAAAEALGREKVVVATSSEASDDPVADYCKANALRVVRGPLDDVVARLQGAIREIGAAAFFRICADSPFYDPAAMRRAMELYDQEEVDLVTNLQPRTFPKGRSVELARASTFLALESRYLQDRQREHVFTIYYENPTRFRIRNFESDRDFSAVNLCIDSPEDLARAESFLKTEVRPPFSLRAEDLCAFRD